MDGCHARNRTGLSAGVPGLQVSVGEGQQPPDHSEEHPGAEEGRGEDEEGVLPLQVHHGGEDVLQEPTLEATETVRRCLLAASVLAPGGTCSRMFLWATLQEPVLVMKRALWDLERPRFGWFWSSARRVRRNPSGRRPFLASMALQTPAGRSTWKISRLNIISTDI